jgi:hypothetical protein
MVIAYDNAQRWHRAMTFPLRVETIFEICEGTWNWCGATVRGAIEIQTATMDIVDYLKQGGQTAGHRELWRLLRTLFKETVDNDELID